MLAQSYISKYATQKTSKGFKSQWHKIPATEKWVEYMLDKHDVNKILMDSDFATKMDLLEVLQVLERKIDYMYRHPNFNFKKATDWFHRLKDATKVTNLATTKTVAKKQRKKR